jgi:NTP pyrophosphatase (non-canonical NTP hydrolase)
MSELTVFDRVRAEMIRASERYGGMASTHEALGVLLEEFDELREAIRSNDMDAVAHEALQVAAVALRIVNATEVPSFQERSGA